MALEYCDIKGILGESIWKPLCVGQVSLEVFTLELPKGWGPVFPSLMAAELYETGLSLPSGTQLTSFCVFIGNKWLLTLCGEPGAELYQ